MNCCLPAYASRPGIWWVGVGWEAAEFSDTEELTQKAAESWGTLRAVGGAAVAGAEIDGFSFDELITKSLVYYGAPVA